MRIVRFVFQVPLADVLIETRISAPEFSLPQYYPHFRVFSAKVKKIVQHVGQATTIPYIWTYILHSNDKKALD